MARYEEGVFSAFKASSFGVGRNAGNFRASFGDGISSLEAAQALYASSQARVLAFLNPERLLAEANDANARLGILHFLNVLGVPGFAGGGLIQGPGSPTSDSIPIMGSRGEFMIQASAVDHFGVGFFEALNRGNVPSVAVNDQRTGNLGSLGADLASVREAVLKIGDAIVDVIEGGNEANEETARAIVQSTKLLERRAS